MRWRPVADRQAANRAPFVERRGKDRSNLRRVAEQKTCDEACDGSATRCCRRRRWRLACIAARRLRPAAQIGAVAACRLLLPLPDRRTALAALRAESSVPRACAVRSRARQLTPGLSQSQLVQGGS
jgi:hypothetical protein